MTIMMLILLGLQQSEPILFVPMTLIVVFLAAKAQVSGNLKRSLGLFSFGLSRRELLFGQCVKGLLLSILGMLPFQLLTWLRLFHAQPFLYVTIPTVILGGLVYLLPLLGQLRSGEFLDHFKN